MQQKSCQHIFIKNAFVKYRAGYANALCVIQSGICIILYFIQKYASKKGGMEDES